MRLLNPLEDGIGVKRVEGLPPPDEPLSGRMFFPALELFTWVVKLLEFGFVFPGGDVVGKELGIDDVEELARVEEPLAEKLCFDESDPGLEPMLRFC